MPRQMPTTLGPRIALKPAEEASSSRSKSAAVVPDVNTPSRTVRPPFGLFGPFSAGFDQFQPTAFMAPIRTSVATEFNSGERTYSTIKPRSPSIRKPRQIQREKLPPHLYKSGGKRRRGDDAAKDAERGQKRRRDSRRALSKACLVTYCNM